MAICKKEYQFLFFIGWRGQDGVMAAGMGAQHYPGARGTFDAEALGADGNATMGYGNCFSLSARNRMLDAAEWITNAAVSSVIWICWMPCPCPLSLFLVVGTLSSTERRPDRKDCM